MTVKCQYKEMVSIKKLSPHPKNPNKHSKDQVKRLAKLIEHHGFRHPIIVSNLSGFIVAGHGRLGAAKELKLKEVPVDYQDFESEEQEYQFLVADNSIADWADLDLSQIHTDLEEIGPFDIELLGIKDFQFEPTPSSGGLTDEDSIPEPQKDRVKYGELWQLGNHRLLCGDATNKEDVDRLMGGEKADMVFTDPPYGISIVKTGSDGASAKIGFVSPRNAPAPLARAREYRAIEGDDIPFDPNLILSIGAETIILWGANHYASRLPDKPQWLIWDKKLESGKLDHNNFSDCELAWTNSDKLSAKIYRHTWAGMLRKGDRKEEMTDRVHPTQKPVGLCEQILNDYKDGSVLDLYGGSGSTLIACEKTNRKCYMMEIDPHYCSIIVERWEQFTGQTAKRL